MKFREFLEKVELNEMDYKGINQVFKKYIDNELKIFYNNKIGGDIIKFLILADKGLENKFINFLKNDPNVNINELSKIYSDVERKIKKYTPKDKSIARELYININKKINSSAMRTLEDMIGMSITPA